MHHLAFASGLFVVCGAAVLAWRFDPSSQLTGSVALANLLDAFVTGDQASALTLDPAI